MLVVAATAAAAAAAAAVVMVMVVLDVSNSLIVRSSAPSGGSTVRVLLERLVADERDESFEHSTDGGVRDSVTCSGGAGLKLGFFHPLLWQKLGTLLVDCYAGKVRGLARIWLGARGP